MRTHLFLFAMLFSIVLNAQLINGSFEESGAFSLTGWEWTCDQPTPVTDTPPDGGSWSARRTMGSTQGCFPSYLFQRIPFAQSGDQWVVSAWVRADSVGWDALPRIGFSSVSNGDFAFQNQAGTTAPYWSYVWIIDTVHATATDTAVVLLTSGFVGGPAFGAGWFDSVELEPANPSSVQEAANAIHQYLDADQVLHLSAGDRTITHVRLFDAAGRMLPIRVSYPGAGAATFGTTTLPIGLYIFRVTTDHGEAATRFVKR